MTSSATRVSEVQRALLGGAIDYAGLFPPASLRIADAARNYLDYAAGSEAWALGRFVVPASRMAELEGVINSFPVIPPHVEWKLSVLASGAPAADRAVLDEFAVRQGPRRRVDAVETKATSAEVISSMRPLVGPTWALYVEVPIGPDIDRYVTAVKSLGACVKLRTGGVTADAFPHSDALARALIACHQSGVAFKATAGLHHPLRGSYPLTYALDAERGTMFGYLNVLLATVLVSRGCAKEDVVAMLDEVDPHAIAIRGAGVAWRGHVLSAEEIRVVRSTQYHGFGSCSFREPLDEWRPLGSSDEIDDR